MNIFRISVGWFVCSLTPISFFVIYSINIYTVSLYLLFSYIIFSCGIRTFKAIVVREMSENLNFRVNATKHNINELLITAIDKKEPISLADSLSIKESIYAIEATAQTRRTTIPTHHRKIRPLLSVSLQDYTLLAKSLGININICFKADEEINIIKLDPSLLNRVLSIVLSNAISVTRPSGTINISTRISKDHYSIIVTDFSGGMKDKTKEKLSDNNIRTLGRRVDVHNKMHYGLGLISLNQLIRESNINFIIKTSGKINDCIIEIPRKIDSIESWVKAGNL